MIIAGNNIKMKLDTGAQCNVISKSLADRCEAKTEQSRTKKLITFSGNEMNVLGDDT